ncbi:TPA: hypothetical protein ACH3X2_009067 [Trebouxia sp. C0005]
MHRITSADALSSTAAASAVATAASDRILPSTVPESPEHAEDCEQGDQDAWDDVPLLQPSRKSKHTFNLSALNPAQLNDHHTSTAWREAIASLRLAAPVTVQAISQFAHILVIMSAVGHIGVDELAAVAVGWTWFNLVRSFCFGLSGAYDTFGSQAFGAGNKVMVLSWAITAIFALLLVNIPVSVGMWYAGDAARVFFQQDANVCQKTATFCRFMIPGLFPWSLVTILMKFLQVQGQMWAPAICTVAAIMVHVPGTLLLVHYLGFAGAGWAVVVMRTAHLSFTIVYLLTLGRRYSRLDQPDPFEPRQEGDEEKGSIRQQGAPLLQPQKSDSASSLRAAYTKDTWEDSDQSAASSTEQQSAVHYSAHELDSHGSQSALLHQAEMHDNQGNEHFEEDRQDLAEQGSKHQTQELLVAAPMQAQQSQHELLDSDQSDSSDQVSISAQHLPQQLQQQQQHVKPLPLQIPQACDLDKEASAVSLVSADGVLSIKQTVLFSLHPARLWAFLGLGIPGGLASSVQSAAYEVTTAMAGVLGTIQIDAHTTMLSVSDILFTFLGYGFGVGCTIRVGQLLGSQRPAQAKLAGAHLVIATTSHWHYKAGE